MNLKNLTKMDQKVSNQYKVEKELETVFSKENSVKNNS